jgi:hypothetical protein
MVDCKQEQVSMSSNPFSPPDYQSRKLFSAIDVLIFGLDTAVLRLNETVMDITEEEYNWEPLLEAERIEDVPMSAEMKRVWRVYLAHGTYTYDYGDRPPDAPAFTTIAWIMNHIATTADMYLYCILSGKPVGEERHWHDLTIYPNLKEMRDYLFNTLQSTRDYLSLLEKREDHEQLNKLTPAPWGELRPVYLNLWGGIVEHALQHAMQIAVRKEQIRVKF